MELNMKLQYTVKPSYDVTGKTQQMPLMKWESILQGKAWKKYGNKVKFTL
jgi:hypothetical protein